MARVRVRNHKAEEAARKRRAIERGFKTRGAQRHAIETGKAPALMPDRVHNPKTVAAQLRYWSERNDHHDSKRDTKGIDLYLQGRPSDEDRATDWSTMFSGSIMGRYSPDQRKRGWTIKAYRDAYLKAWVEGPERYKDVRYETGGSRALKHWFIEANDFFTQDEYEARYGRHR